MKLTFKTKLLMVIALVLFAATIGLGFYYISIAGSSGPELENFSGSSKEAVLAWAAANKVKEDRIVFAYEYSETADADTVISQSIEEADTLRSTDTLTITLSNGPDPDLMVTIPDFQGKKIGEIQTWFQTNRFSNVVYTYTASEEIPADTFVSSTPPSGKSAKRSSKVTIAISTGNETEETEVIEVTVPDFSSYTKTNIQAWGSSNRIGISFETKASDTIAKDKVISQTPKAGTKIRQGSSVSIVLSAGKGLTVTSFVGQSKTEADAWVRANGLKAVYQTQYSDTRENIILSQDPSSGAIAEGGTITFRISAGKVVLDDYTGRSKAEIEAAIADLNTRHNRSANLRLSVKESESDSPVGTILSQSASGSLSPGSTITITTAVGKRITVKDYAGKSETEFRSYLSSLGLKPGNIAYAYHDSYANGVIIRNDTGTFAEGSSISYTVSRGSYDFQYGSLIKAGSSWSALDQAAGGARANGWTVSASYSDSKEFESGIIMEDCSVSGKTISCKVSNGRVVTVPDTIGSSYEAALSSLKGAGLNANAIETADYRDEPKGQVIGQSVAAGSTVKAGTTVTIIYSKGPKPIETAALPNFNISFWDGQSEAKIRSDMTTLFSNAGFTNLKFVVKDSSTGNNYNGIESITPYPNGAVIDKTTEITIVILVGKS